MKSKQLTPGPGLTAGTLFWRMRSQDRNSENWASCCYRRTPRSG